MILVSAGLFLQALAPSTPLLNVRELLTQSPAESANLALNDPASAKQADTAGAVAQAGTPESAESPDPAAVFPSTTPSNEAASQDLEPLNGAPQALALTTEPPGAAQARHRTGEQRPATAQPTAQPDMPAKPADAATAEVSAAASSPSAESTVPAVEPADAPATASPGETAAPLLELPEPAVPTGDQAAAADRESADQPQPPQPQAEPANHPQPMALPQPPAGPLTGQLRREVAADPNPVRLHVASYDPQQAADAIGQWAQAHGVTVLSQTLTDRPTLRLRLTAGQLPRLLAHLSRSPQHLALLQTGPTPIGQQQANWKRELIGELPLSPAVRLDHPDVVMELPIIVTERAQPLPPPTPSPPPLAPSTSHPTPSAPGQLPPPPAAEPPRPQPQ